jgi:sulfite reductase alpha subunit-like flavoprotein
MTKVTILFGSQTGNAMEAAERIGRESKFRGFDVRVLPADSYMYMIDQFPDEDIVICILSTTGQGEFPDNCSQFWKFLRKKSLARDSLSNIRCGVFGLGDSGYPKYNFSAKRIHKRLGDLGATFLVPLGLGDDQHAHGYDASLDIWLSQLWKSLGVHIHGNELNCNIEKKVFVERVTAAMEELTEGEELDRGRSDYFDSILAGSRMRNLEEQSWFRNNKTFGAHTVYSTRVLQNKRVTAANHFQDVRLLTLGKPKGSEINPGDAVGIWPKQSHDDIVKLLHRCSLRYDEVVRVTYGQERECNDDILVKAGNLLGGFIDIRGAPPSRTFLQIMSQVCPEGIYKERLSHLSSARGREEFHEYVMQEGRNLFEVLEDFPCVPLDLEWILSFAPKLQCRYYSASCYPLCDTVEILAGLVEWKTPGRHLRKGLCSRTLADAMCHDELLIQIARGDLQSPPQHTPLILIAPGTGIAPLRSFLQERAIKRQENPRTIAPSILFFGCRDRSKDYYFQNEWNSMVSSGVLEKVIVAASREGTPRMYVQDQVEKHGELVWKYILDGAHIFVCGRAGSMPQSVQRSLLKIICSHGKLSQDTANKLLSQRQHVECWN